MFSRTEISLEEPGAPVRRDGDQRQHGLPERIAVDHHLPDFPAASVDERCTESPECGREREDNEVVQEEEGEQLVGDVALHARLGDISRTRCQLTEAFGQETVERGSDGRRDDTLDDTLGGGWASKLSWKAGHTRPRWERLDRKTAMKPFGTTQANVSRRMQEWLMDFRRRRCSSDRCRLPQM